MMNTFVPFLLRIFSLRKSGPWRKNSLTIGKGVRLQGRVRLQCDKTSQDNQIVIGDGCVLKNTTIHFTGTDSKLILGEKVHWKGHIRIRGDHRTVFIGARTTCLNCYILCRDADVHIGEGCLISRGIEIRTSDVHKVVDMDSKEQINKPAPVWLGDHVWIAANVTISKGAHISKGSVVGAMSFVNKRFDEPNVVIVGVPAKIVRRAIRWER